MNDRIPDWKLERYLLRELPPQEMAHLEQLLPEHEELRQRLAALEANGEQIRQQYPAAWMARQIQMRATRAEEGAVSVGGQFSSLWRWSPALAIGLVAIVAMPLMRQPAPHAAPVLTEQGLMEQTSIEQVRLKGTGARLLLHRKAEDGSQRLADGAPAAAGDLVMIQYDAADAAYGLIFSIDGSGVVTRHLPMIGDQASALGKGLVSLEHAYELDDAPAWESFYFITGREAFAVEPILAAAIATASGDQNQPPQILPLPSGLEQSHRTLLKSSGESQTLSERR